MDASQSAREPDRPELTDKAVRYAPLQAILSRHERHPAGGSTIREVVFGANDGLISSLALVSGMAGATPNRSAILIAGLAGVVAGTVSMAIGAFVSTKSVREFQESEEQRERYEIEHVPELEREELAEIYRQKGFAGAELERVLDRLTENPERWLRVMMAEELGLAGEVLNPYMAALVMGVAFALGGIVPVMSYFWSEGDGRARHLGWADSGRAVWRRVLERRAGEQQLVEKGTGNGRLGRAEFYPVLWDRLAARRLDLSAQPPLSARANAARGMPDHVRHDGSPRHGESVASRSD